VEEGASGFIVNSEQGAVEALRAIPQMSRAGCRAMFDKRFTDVRMAEDYLKVYEAVSEASAASPSAGHRASDLRSGRGSRRGSA